jgi:hypothetical protein
MTFVPEIFSSFTPDRNWLKESLVTLLPNFHRDHYTVAQKVISKLYLVAPIFVHPGNIKPQPAVKMRNAFVLG